MSDLKDKAINKNNKPASEHELTESEFKYLKAMNASRVNIDREFQSTMTAYLDYIATSRLEYAGKQTRQFEVDLSDDSRILKVTVLPDSEKV